MRLTLEMMSEYIREQLMEEMKRLDISYSHTTQTYQMQNLVVYHSNRVAPRAASSQSSRHICRTDRYIDEQSVSTGFSFEILKAIHDMII